VQSGKWLDGFIIKRRLKKMNCPKCGFVINAGSELARLGKGVKKSLTEEDRARRSKLMKRVRQDRRRKE
jgi:hypothetical protein